LHAVRRKDVAGAVHRDDRVGQPVGLRGQLLVHVDDAEQDVDGGDPGSAGVHGLGGGVPLDQLRDRVPVAGTVAPVRTAQLHHRQHANRCPPR